MAYAGSADITPAAVVVGESLVDLVTRSAGQRSAHAGGSPLNVAVGLARLGVSTELATRLSDDSNGQLIRRHLADSGVSLNLGSKLAGRTATSRATISADGSATYNFDITWDLEEIGVGRPLVVHTGSLATVIEPGASNVERILGGLAVGTLVTFDPNVRPSLTPSRAMVRSRVERIGALAHVVKLSEEDASWLYPCLSILDVAERYAALGVDLFVMTRAERGCTVASGGRLRHLPAERTAVVDTIGAGDAFMSGLIYELLRSEVATQLAAGDVEHELLDDCARTALRSAAVSVSRAGASPPSRLELSQPS